MTPYAHDSDGAEYGMMRMKICITTLENDKNQYTQDLAIPH